MRSHGVFSTWSWSLMPILTAYQSSIPNKPKRRVSMPAYFSSLVGFAVSVLSKSLLMRSTSDVTQPMSITTSTALACSTSLWLRPRTVVTI